MREGRSTRSRNAHAMSATASQRRRRFRRREAARQDAEVVGLQLQHHGARDAPVRLGAFALVTAPGFFGEATDVVFDLRQAQVAFEGVFRADLHRRAFGLHRMVVDAVREFVQAPSPAAEALFERRGAERAQVRHRRHAEFGELGFHHLADARQPADGQGREEGFDLVRADHEQAIGLAPVRGDLREELVRRDAGRRGEFGFLADLRADRLRGGGRARQAGEGLGDVEVGLVERQRFDQVGVAREDLAHLLRHRLVAHEIRRHEHRLRAQALGADRRHRRAHAELARLVTRRAHHRARAAPRDDHRPAAQGRVVALLDGRIERVHVDVQDLALWGFFAHRQNGMKSASGASSCGPRCGRVMPRTCRPCGS